MSNQKNHLDIKSVFYCLWFFGVITLLSGCTNGKATLLWNEIPGATSYNVYMSESPGVTKISSSKISNATNPLLINELESGKTYYFVVTVVNEQGESEKSKELSYTAVANKTGLIYFKNLFEKSIQVYKSSTYEKGTVTLDWPKVPTAIFYNIYWNDSPWVTINTGKKISNVKSPHTIEGLKQGTTYYFVVTAVNRFEEIQVSEEISFTID
jgi:YHS domain-containing protein